MPPLRRAGSAMSLFGWSMSAQYIVCACCARRDDVVVVQRQAGASRRATWLCLARELAGVCGDHRAHAHRNTFYISTVLSLNHGRPRAIPRPLFNSSTFSPYSVCLVAAHTRAACICHSHRTMSNSSRPVTHRMLRSLRLALNTVQTHRSCRV